MFTPHTPSNPWAVSGLPTRRLRALALAWLLPGVVPTAPAAAATPTTSVSPVYATAAPLQGGGSSSHEGVVEAVRQTEVAAQVPGTLLALSVRAGDRVSAGQSLARIDARAADQGAVAGQAQASAAEAQAGLAAAELERKRGLFAKNYISRAALEQAEAQLAAATASVRAARAQAGAARTQSGLHVVRAPYAGVVAALHVTQGDMAMPGRPLLTLYDPTALRVKAAVPASLLTGRPAPLGPADVRLDIPALGKQEAAPATRIEVLPTVDPQTLTQTVWVDLPASVARQLAPGQFARLVMPGAAQASGAAAALGVPAAAVLQRSELTAVYVRTTGGTPQLRQVRIGRRVGDQVEILSGLDAGERVLLDPARALRAAQAQGQP